MSINDIVRQKMAELREERGWTQTEVASRLNISQRAYSHYENGSRNISVEMLTRLADLYDVPVSFILDEKE